MIFFELVIALSYFHLPCFADIPSKLLDHNYEGPEKIYCPLEWVPSQNGESPEENIVAFNTDEIVARIDVSGNQAIGRLSPEDRLTYATLPSLGTVHSSANYEILTNPFGCILEWVDSIAVDFPRHSVLNCELGIGRGYLIDSEGNINNIGGAVIKGEGLLVSFQGRQENIREYQILTSTYPLLEGYLYNFTFSTLENLEPNGIEVIDSEIIIKAAGNFELSQEIHHSGIVEEMFKFSEKQLHWKGISKVSQKVTSFFATFQKNDVLIENSNDFQLLTIQDRQLDFKRTVKFSATENANVQICSAASILQDTEIEYQAMGRFIGPNNMRAETVKEILQVSGRIVVETNGNEAVAIIHGSLNGKFVLGKLSSATTSLHPQSCYKMSIDHH